MISLLLDLFTGNAALWRLASEVSQRSHELVNLGYLLFRETEVFGLRDSFIFKKSVQILLKLLVVLASNHIQNYIWFKLGHSPKRLPVIPILLVLDYAKVDKTIFRIFNRLLFSTSS